MKNNYTRKAGNHIDWGRSLEKSRWMDKKKKKKSTDLIIYWTASHYDGSLNVSGGSY